MQKGKMRELQIYLVRHAESTNNVLQHRIIKIKSKSPNKTKKLIHDLEQLWLAKRSSDPR